MWTNIKRFVLFILLFVLSIISVACTKDKKDPEEQIDPIKPIENVVKHSQYTILTDSIYETEVHIFESNIVGPTVMIVGGIHGDELAGWNAGLKLLEKKDYKGKVIVIPKANILATKLEKRYPGISSSGFYEGIKYEDLNRSFPGKSDGTVTEKIAYAIIEEVTKYNPKYLIDLHESLRSYSDASPKLGDQLLYNKKSTILVYDIVEEFNKTCLEFGDVHFAVDGPGLDGSINDYCGNNQIFGFTIETNRQLPLEKRISQQLDVLDIFFNYIWNE